MKEYIYNCEIVTPTLSHGADTKLPELRTSELKALIRFFYRAVTFKDNHRELYKQEGKLFGNTNESSVASNLRLCISPEKQRTEERKMFFRQGKNVGNNIAYILPNANFKVYLSHRQNNEQEFLMFKKLFELSALLGGIGCRSRRARGCFNFTGSFIKPNEMDSNDVLNALFNILNSDHISKGNYKLENNVIKLIKNIPVSYKTYPFIEQIHIGLQPYKNWEELLSKVDQAAHDVNVEGGSPYTGFVKGGGIRMASPEYVSAIKLKDNLYYPIITSLYAAFDGGINGNALNGLNKEDKRLKFKKIILG